MIKGDLENSSYPTWTYGFEKIPPYLMPPSEEMLSLIRSQAREMSRLAVVELAATAAKEKQLADDQMKVTDITYDTMKNPDFHLAEDRHRDVIKGYRSGEIKRLTAYKERDGAKKPETDEDLARMLGNRVSRDPEILRQVELQMQLLSLNEGEERATPRETGRKRQKIAGGSRSNTPTRTASPNRGPGTSQSTGQNRERSRDRGRARNRGGQRGRNQNSNDSRQNPWRGNQNNDNARNYGPRNVYPQQGRHPFGNRGGAGRGRGNNNNQGPPSQNQRNTGLERRPASNQRSEPSRNPRRNNDEQGELLRLLCRRVLGDNFEE
jgi:hypothetical protein